VEGPKSQYRGVAGAGGEGGWHVVLKDHGDQIHMGRFEVESEAAKSYDRCGACRGDDRGLDASEGAATRAAHELCALTSTAAREGTRVLPAGGLGRRGGAVEVVGEPQAATPIR
jgi:hypothetical protein